MSDTRISAYALINSRTMPMDRGARFEDPLMEALESNGFGEVVGGGTMQSADGEIAYCGVDVDIHDVEKGVPFICEFLEECGAPRGSKLQFQVDDTDKEVPFGFLEGVGIYLNGTDLPDEVYRDCDVNHVYEEIERLLGERGEIQGHWQGPTETALYLYGYSVDEMKGLIAEFVSTYPLCDRARFETIA